MKTVFHLIIITFLILLASRNPFSKEIASGTFTDKGGQHTAGTYRIELTNNQLVLTLTQDFQTNEGPDLHLVLTPTATDAAENNNIMADGKALVIAPLKSLSGEQAYDLPADTDLSQYQSVAIYCIKFSHLYGAAPLR